MAAHLTPHAVIVEEGMEVTSLVFELRASMARIWTAAQASGRPELLAEARDLAPDMAEVERHSLRISGLAEAVA